MGRAHPVGIMLAAILFGVLYQGGAELAFDKPKISRDMIVVIQGLVVLFAGALEHMFRRPVATLLARRIDAAADLRAAAWRCSTPSSSSSAPASGSACR